MNKTIRALSLSLCGFITVAVLWAIIPQLNLIAILLVLGLSVSLILTSFVLKGHLDLTLFIVSYSMSASAGMGLTYYQLALNDSQQQLLPLALLTILVGLSNVVCELYIRKKLQLMAEGCLRGRKLEDYTRNPWLYLDGKSKKDFFILYFDIPQLNKWALTKHTKTIKELENEIFQIVINNIGINDGILLRKSEDSFIIVFEPNKNLDMKSFKTPERLSAYQSLLCALKTKNSIDELAELKSCIPLKELKGRALVIKDEGLILKHIRSGKVELSLFSNALNRISELVCKSNGEDIICDSQTYELASNYFSARKLKDNNYQINGLSAHVDDGL